MPIAAARKPVAALSGGERVARSPALYLAFMGL